MLAPQQHPNAYAARPRSKSALSWQACSKSWQAREPQRSALHGLFALRLWFTDRNPSYIAIWPFQREDGDLGPAGELMVVEGDKHRSNHGSWRRAANDRLVVPGSGASGTLLRAGASRTDDVWAAAVAGKNGAVSQRHPAD